MECKNPRGGGAGWRPAENEVERAQALSSLSDREKRVLRLRYGLGTDREYTLEEIGKHLSVTRERGTPDSEPGAAEAAIGQAARDRRRRHAASPCVR